MRNLASLVGAFGLFLGWNAPNHYPPWPAFHLELWAAVGLTLICFSRLAPEGRATRNTTHAGLPVPLSATVWLTVSALPLAQFGLLLDVPFRGDALLALLYGLGVALAIYTGQLWAAQDGPACALRDLYVTTLIAGLAAVGLALVQWFRLPAPGWWAMELIGERPFANFAQPNHLGLLLVTAVCAVTALYEFGDIQRRWVWGLALAFLGWGILMTQSRAATLALVAVAILWTLSRGKVPTRLRVRDMTAAVLAGVLMALVHEPLRDVFLLNDTAILSTRSGIQDDARTLIWLHFWTAIMDQPWLGHGFNQTVSALASVADRVNPSRNVIYAHNFVLDLMIWMGIPFAVLSCFALAFWTLRWLRRDENSLRMAQRHGVFAIWLALALQSLLEFPYAHSYFLLPAALFAGVVTAPDLGTRVARPTRGAVGLATLGFALLSLTAWEYFHIEGDFRQNRFSRANIGNVEVQLTLDHPVVLDQLAALNKSAAVQVGPGMSNQDIDLLYKLSRRFHMLPLRVSYAKALYLNGDIQMSQQEICIIRSALTPHEQRAFEINWQRWMSGVGGLIASETPLTEQSRPNRFAVPSVCIEPRQSPTSDSHCKPLDANSSKASVLDSPC